MDEKDITNKLQSFLQNHSAFKEECEAVYLLVEIRKILEYGGNYYKTLRFYCNWVLHKELNQERTTKLLSDIFETNIDFGKCGYENACNIKSVGADFFKLDKFKKELKKFFKDKRLPMDLLNKNWWTFRKLLLEIIKDCPVIFTPNKIQRLEVIGYNNGDYGYKFSLNNGKRSPVIKLKLKQKK